MLRHQPVSLRIAFRLLALAPMILGAVACGGSDTPTGSGTAHDTIRVALTDLATGSYLGFRGGLYPDGRNDPSSAHAAAGSAAAARIQPLDANGKPSLGGRIVLLSIGMSNTTMEFCSGAFPTCATFSFIGQARADAAVDHTTLVIVDGARGGQAANSWTSPTMVQFDSAKGRLTRAGVTEAQVQVAWIKQANIQPQEALPDTGADAYTLERELGDIVRALKVRYPNLRQVFLSSRIYGGYATSALNPEPYAYEGGFSVKWLVEAQIAQMQNGGTVRDARAGDLNYSRTPWLAWGPYLWANGMKARSDGLTYAQQDFGTDGTHPNQSADQKVGKLLLDFFKTSPFTKCWFLVGQRCP